MGGRVLTLEVQNHPHATVLRCSGRIVHGDASDEELPTLVKRVLDEKLSRKDIKKAVTRWRRIIRGCRSREGKPPLNRRQWAPRALPPAVVARTPPSTLSLLQLLPPGSELLRAGAGGCAAAPATGR
jgi:uncharacterized protein DUF6526